MKLKLSSETNIFDILHVLKIKIKGIKFYLFFF